jgi:transmembrane sensor
MAEIHPLPSIEDAEREASEWIARLNADDVTAEDRANFEAWRQAHPRHARSYEELSATWQQLQRTGRLVRAVSLGNALNASAEAAIRPAKARSRVLLAAAATLAAVLVGGWWWINAFTPRTAFQTAVGEHASIELPDGSMLQLNSNSLARVDYDDRMRLVRLDRGEAFFKVQHDTRRPFWVVAGDSWVRAVGTEFSVHVRTSGVRVTVNEGIVRVVAAAESDRDSPSDTQAAAQPASLLHAGQQVDVSKRAIDIRSVAPNELTRSLAWRSGTLYFENQPLGDVIDELSRYTTLHIVIADDGLRTIPVGGTFQSNARGADALLTMLQDGFGLQIRRDGDTVHIDRDGKIE